ncbi:FAD-dependent monooxygenase [Anianabacter salinae]|uniref:FAD-dependent monooxygenase n=1 Tax=Anianabacter salinae TaxID=2851023 RepID=UPI00225E4CD2|nr:FAD-dependent monooxygenase [Anianabacter salinae]MBV0912483.1 FAD-dependent monooxygenase [Anianabacter salinae]
MAEDTDILISGGGLAGLITAAVFGHAGFTVRLVDPAPPVTDAEADGSDLRSTAFLRPARDLFERIGLWDVLGPHATPLEVLEAVDTHGWPPEVVERRAFRSGDLGETPFGWNLMNWLTRREVLGFLAGQPNVTLSHGVGFAGMLQRTSGALVRLSDGTRVQARLVIGADGRASPVRQAAGIGASVTRYGQKALAFTVTHPVPHGNVSTEIYNQGGAFTLVPLPDLGGVPCSAVVWMNDGPRAVALAAMAPGALGKEASLRSCHLFGALTPASEVRVWPVVTQVADALVAERVALVAEAAHVLPPIGAQGLNTSLHDVAALLALAEAHRGDPGSASVLASYARERRRDIVVRARVIDAFNRICRSGEAPIQALRALGLRGVHDVAPVRRAVMRAGLGS